VNKFGFCIRPAQATDADTVVGNGGALKYAIVNGDAARVFVLDARTGVLRLNVDMSETDISSALLNVSCTDAVFTTYARVDVLVRATARHSRPPHFTAISLSTVVKEDAAVGSVITSARVIDGNAPIQYSLGGVRTYGPFAIDALTAQLTVARQLDHETAKVYALPLVAVDSVGRRAFATLHIDVLDVNDNAPVFVANEYTLSVPVNASVGRLIAVVRVAQLASHSLVFSWLPPTPTPATQSSMHCRPTLKMCGHTYSWASKTVN
jgi:protocadherin Fat 1/2/3